MQRREALRLLAATAALPILSRDAFSLFREVHQQLAEAPALKTLNPHQNATVTAISELIVPQTDTPGAKAVRVNEFIDLILTEWYEGDEKSAFSGGPGRRRSPQPGCIRKGFHRLFRKTTSPDSQQSRRRAGRNTAADGSASRGKIRSDRKTILLHDEAA